MRRRTGFTIVELLVSMALIVFIMAILSEAFAAGFRSFRDLKALGDMNERLRLATNTLRKYLQADHFEGRKRLSDPNFWQDGPPREGFFRIEQDSGSQFEGNSNTLIPSYSATTHRLHFTAKLRGNDRGDFFPASYAGATNSPQLMTVVQNVPGYRDVAGAYQAQWVEVAAFLRPTEIAVSEKGTSPGQLYALHLRTKALIPEMAGTQDVPVGPADLAALADFSLFNGSLANTPADVTIPKPYVTIPERRGFQAITVGGARTFLTLAEETAALNPSRAGADVLLTDVLSMNVRVLVAGMNDFYDLNDLNGQWPQKGAATPAVFDTWSQSSQTSLGLPDLGNPISGQYWANTIPRYQNQTSGGPPIRVKAIQVILRIWDVKTEQTRQVTLIVDL